MAVAWRLPSANTAGPQESRTEFAADERSADASTGAAWVWSVFRRRQQAVTCVMRSVSSTLTLYIKKKGVSFFFFKVRENHKQRKLAVGRGAAGIPPVAGGDVKRGSRFGRPRGGFLQDETRSRHTIQQSRPWHLPRELKTSRPHKNPRVGVYSSSARICQNLEATKASSGG